ncbi:MAG TPA: cache domain-containing protein, partial [Spirochaetia bacterium]
MPPRARLTLAFLLLVFLPGLLVSVVLSRLYLGVLSESASRQTAEVVDQVSQNIRGEVDAVSILVAALYQDRELRSLADSFALTKDPGRRLLISNRLDDKMAGFFNYTNRVGAVVLFLRGGAVYYDRNNSTIGSITGIDRSVYAPARAEPGKVYLFDTLAGLAPVGADGYLLTVAVCPTPQEGGTQLDAVVVTFRVPYFDRLVARPSASGRDVVIFGRGGQAILSSLPAGTEIDAVRPAGPGADARGPREVTIGGRPWLASPLRMESTGWTIVFLT